MPVGSTSSCPEEPTRPSSGAALVVDKMERVTYTPRSWRPKDSQPWAARIIKDRRKTLPSSMRDPFSGTREARYLRSRTVTFGPEPGPSDEPVTVAPPRGRKQDRTRRLDYARVDYK